MAVNYSGLLQTSGELAKAQEQELGSYAAGAQQAGVAMAKPLLNIAKKEQERLDQLEKDQSIAAEWLGQMADTSSLLGDFEGPIADFALQTKSILNDIAKDENLNQYEKMAKYKEAVDAFNKRVSKYSGDQEIIAGLTGRFAKGEIGGGVEQTSNEYQIGRAFAHGKWELQGDTYIIKGEDGKPIQLTGEDGNPLKIDSSYLKNMHLPDRQYIAGETMGKLATMGLQAKDKAQAEALASSNMWATCFDKSSCSTWLTENNFKNQSEVRAEFYNEDTGKWDMAGMQDLVKSEGLKIINASRVKSLGSIVKEGSDEYRARQTWQMIEDMRVTGNYSNITGKAGGRYIESAYVGDDGLLRLRVIGSNNEIIDSGRGYDLEDLIDRLALGNMMIGEKDVGTRSRFNTFLRAQEALRLEKKGDPEEKAKIGYDEEYKFEVGGDVDLDGYSPEILNMSNETIVNPKMMKEAKGTAGGRSIVINSIFSNKETISYEEHNERIERYKSKYGEYTEQNLAKFRQDEEGLSDQEKRSRVLEKNISNFAAIEKGNRQVGEDFDNINQLKEFFELTDKEVKKLKGWKYKTFNELIRELHKINTGGKGNERYLEAYNAGLAVKEERQKALANKGLNIN